MVIIVMMVMRVVIMDNIVVVMIKIINFFYLPQIRDYLNRAEEVLLLSQVCK